MADEDGVKYMKNTKTIHYGAISTGTTQLSILHDAKSAGNINISDETMELSHPQSSGATSGSQQDLVDMFERRRKIREMKAPTEDAEVKAQLRQLGMPICQFGEDAADRRQRLKEVLAELGEEAVELIASRAARAVAADEKRATGGAAAETETWYHEGPESLRAARYWIAKYSCLRARNRLEKARQLKLMTDSQRKTRYQSVQKFTSNLTNVCSQIGDIRPLSWCQFSPDNQLLVTASWSGLCKLWTVPDCEPVRTLRGHAHQVGCCVFHPQATLTLDEESCCLASCALDGSVKLWSLTSDEPIADIEGHAPHRVSRLAFHPSGRFMATCCWDSSWRLWDLEAQEEVLHQEGHSAPVYDISFHPDGSLALTGGMDSFARLWDLRTGQCCMFLEGHLRPVLTTDISHNGYHVCTGAEDNQCKVWDMRQRKCIYTIPAHNNLISKVCFDKKYGGQFIVTASYDCTAKVWSHPGWSPVRTLAGHEGRLLCVDMSGDGEHIATASYDRTFKLWAVQP